MPPDLRSILARDSLVKAALLARWPELAEDHQALLDTLDGLSDLDDQVAAAMRTALEREAFAGALDGMIDDMVQRAFRLRDGATKIRATVLWVMQESGRPKIAKPDMTISVRAGHVGYTVTDIDAVPEQYVVIKRRPNMVEIARAMKAGDRVAGVVEKNGAAFIAVNRK